MSEKNKSQQKPSSNASIINESSSDESLVGEQSFRFYGGISWKQIEYNSQYQYCYKPGEAEDSENNPYSLVENGISYYLKVKNRFNS